ncbi:hypothetical protein RchiOBHm_Chr2g0095641 [Rosa chinensis]|uniref:Uncharacterized protein n=1 Tax=Rosa chinensis TaxID=74649 RepID=A0A2P6RKY5_ROSCH|nr:hypothetical protein RchiOBHm_Chr2g0095641 [Rosa chinensis]
MNYLYGNNTKHSTSPQHIQNAYLLLTEQQRRDSLLQSLAQTQLNGVQPRWTQRSWIGR